MMAVIRTKPVLKDSYKVFLKKSEEFLGAAFTRCLDVYRKSFALLVIYPKAISYNLNELSSPSAGPPERIP
jgi:hypothetical protein